MKLMTPTKSFVIALVPSWLVACMSTTVIDEHKVATALPPAAGDESVVVLGRRYGSGQETEIDFISCIDEHLASGDDGLNVIPEQQFVDSLYPYFEASTAPMNVKNLDRLVQNTVVAEKFRDYNLRYLVWIDGFTERVDRRGSMSCAVGPGGGACLGFTSWDDESNYEATIWDFKSLALAGKISEKTTGTSYMPAVLIPIPLLARVQSHACKNMAQQIAEQISTSLR